MSSSRAIPHRPRAPSFVPPVIPVSQRASRFIAAFQWRNSMARSLSSTHRDGCGRCGIRDDSPTGVSQQCYVANSTGSRSTRFRVRQPLGMCTGTSRRRPSVPISEFEPIPWFSPLAPGCDVRFGSKADMAAFGCLLFPKKQTSRKSVRQTSHRQKCERRHHIRTDPSPLRLAELLSRPWLAVARKR